MLSFTQFYFCLSWRVLTLRLGDGITGDSWDGYCPQLCVLSLSWKLLPSCSWQNWMLRETSFRLPDFMPAHKLRWLGGEPTSHWAMPAAQVVNTQKERGWPFEGGAAALLAPLSRTTGWVAAHRSFFPIFVNTNVSNSGDTLSLVTHQEKKWQNAKWQKENMSPVFSFFVDSNRKTNVT